MKLQDANIQAKFASEGQYKARLEQAVKTADTAYERAKAEMALVAEQAFQFYSILIVGKTRQLWTKIMTEQIDATPWTDIQGVEHADQPCKSWDSIMECVRFHLLTVFCNDAADTEKHCISTCLKKPNWVHIRQFVQTVQQLNGYLELLPCLFCSPQVTKLKKKLGL
jgi:hypothetical protein